LQPKHHGATPRETLRIYRPNRVAYKSSNISETRQDMTKVTLEVIWEVIYAISIAAKINDLG